jgi:hypothetical protein
MTGLPADARQCYRVVTSPEKGMQTTPRRMCVESSASGRVLFEALEQHRHAEPLGHEAGHGSLAHPDHSLDGYVLMAVYYRHGV